MKINILLKGFIITSFFSFIFCFFVSTSLWAFEQSVIDDEIAQIKPGSNEYGILIYNMPEDATAEVIGQDFNQSISGVGKIDKILVGSYTIKVLAKDAGDHESFWSTFSISMPKTRDTQYSIIQLILIKLFINHPMLIKIIHSF